MFIVLLRFSTNKGQASAFLEAHKAWIDEGVRDGVFALVGSLKPNLGGVVLAQGVALADLERRVAADPFVEHGVVSSEILEITPSKADERLQFLLG